MDRSSTTRSTCRTLLLFALACLLAAAAVGMAPARTAHALSIGWTATDDRLSAERWNHSATLLPDGRVLVAGGHSANRTLSSAELFDPGSGQWSPTSSLHQARESHSATLLRDGRVLVTGGVSGTLTLASAEIYDPANGAWVETGAMSHARAGHVASRLPDGRVMVNGGYDGSALGSTELYDPASGAWSSGAASLPRSSHAAVVTLNGRLLVTGGYDGAPLTSAQLYNPAENSWTSLHGLHYDRSQHTATLLPDGQVLVVGGNSGEAFLSSTEVLSTTSPNWSGEGDLATERCSHSATLLANGQVLVVGGRNLSGRLDSAELYDPATRTWSPAGALNKTREYHTATLLADGRVLVVGGQSDDGQADTSEIYDPATPLWEGEDSLGSARAYHAASLLVTGDVLVAGGYYYDSGNHYLSSAEVYDVSAGSWSDTASMTTARARGTLTLLPNGRVLAAGGRDSSSTFNIAQTYYWSSNMWYVADSLNHARYDHTATLLPSGQVLVSGGSNWNGTFDTYISSAELYDPDADTWTDTGSLSQARSQQSATLLGDGRVLVVGGFRGGTGATRYSSRAELYDPATGAFTTTSSLSSTRARHSATLLPDGRVLVAGGVTREAGSDIDTYPDLCYAYEPATGVWGDVARIPSGRADHTATLLPDGRVLLAGGRDAGGALSDALIYDPATDSWTTGPTMSAARYDHCATLLLDGRVLVAGGVPSGALAGCESYERGLDFSRARQPVITTMTYPLPAGARLDAAGTGFIGASEGSGGANDSSPANYPLVQLLRVDSGLMVWLRPARGSFSDTSYHSARLAGVQPGHALLTVFVNGIPSTSRLTLVSDAETYLPLALRN